MPIIDTTESTFAADVLRNPRPVLLDFWGPLCLPCQQLEPRIASLARDYEGRMDIVRVNWPREPAICAQYRVTFVPAFILIRDGAPIARFDGYSATTGLEGRLAAALVDAPHP